MSADLIRIICACALALGSARAQSGSPPTITQQPLSQTIKQGSNTTFSVTATGSTPLNYQWLFNQTNSLAAGTNFFWSTTNAQAADQGGYSVIVTNVFGAVTSQVASLTVLVRPLIIIQPQSLTVAVGEDATWMVTVRDDATLPINFQWRKASIALTNFLLNQTSCSFTLHNVQTNVTATDGPGSYRVAISNTATPVALVGSSVVSLSVVLPQAPEAITATAGDVAGDGATLNGSVNPNGSTTTARFDYGLTLNYGNSSPPIKPGNSTNAIRVSVATPGLLPGTLYHYRLLATNSGGVSVGGDQTVVTLNTPVPAPLVMTLPVGTVGLASAVLKGNVDAHQGYAAAYFEYGLTPQYGLTMPAYVLYDIDPVLVSAEVVGLSAAATYHFRAVAFNSSGTNFGADQSFQTLQPPELVTLTVKLVTSREALLVGSVNPKGVQYFAHFDYGRTTNYGSSTTPIDVGNGIDPILLTNIVEGLVGDPNYHFRQQRPTYAMW